MKWNNPAFKKQLRPIGLDGLVRDPQPIAFNLNQENPKNSMTQNYSNPQSNTKTHLVELILLASN
jgi:hypothetical protein